MLSWNEMKHRAIAFSRDWKGTTSEKSERQTFWNEFFEVFGKKRRTLAAFEEPVKKLSGSWGYIDSGRSDEAPHWLTTADFIGKSRRYVARKVIWL